MPVEKTVEELFEEFATLKYLESEENEYVTNEKYAQIIQEVKSQMRRETLENVYTVLFNNDDMRGTSLVRAHALSKGIIINK